MKKWVERVPISICFCHLSRKMRWRPITRPSLNLGATGVTGELPPESDGYIHHMYPRCVENVYNIYIYNIIIIVIIIIVIIIITIIITIIAIIIITIMNIYI